MFKPRIRKLYRRIIVLSFLFYSALPAWSSKLPNVIPRAIE